MPKVSIYHVIIGNIPSYLGLLLISKHRLEEALNRFQYALQIDPNYSNYINNLGWFIL